MRIFSIQTQQNNTTSFQCRHTAATEKALRVVDRQLEKMSTFDLIGNNMAWQSMTSDGVKNSKNIEEISIAMYEIGKLRDKLQKAKPFVQAVTFLQENCKSLSLKQKAIVKSLFKDINESSNSAKIKIKTSALSSSELQMLWQKAKSKSNFNIISDDLKAYVDRQREFLSAQNGHKACYDDFLDRFNPGWKTEDIDSELNNLGDNLTPFLKKIRAKIAEDPTINNLPFLKNRVSQKTIDTFVDRVTKDMGFDFKRGKIGKTEHPFMFPVNGRYDSRIALGHTNENPTIADFLDTVGAAVHECGHALVGQNMPKNLHNTPLDGFAMDMHESQSRFWENMIGKSKEFWQHYLPVLKEIEPKVFKDVTVDDLYRGVNKVDQNPIRVSADELSYNLHILQRYNLEKEFVNNENFDFSKLPEKWNNESEKLLGFKPKNDREGVLQDVHWYDDLIGYFPAYSLGSLAYPQFFNAMKKSMPDLEDKISKGNFKPIKNWLKNNVYKDGKMYTSKELIEKSTGEPLNSKYFTDYITKKYSEIYDI